MSRALKSRTGGRSSQVVSVARHDTSCAVLRGGTCGCSPVTSTQSYERVCAVCGGGLYDKRLTYCSSACKFDNRVRGKNKAARQESEEIRLAGARGDP